MPQLKQPMPLQDKCLQECVNLYCGACVRWISKLLQAQISSRRVYLITTRSVLAECCQIRRSLSELPYFVIEMMSPQLTSKFADMIINYDNKHQYKQNAFWDRESHSSICSAMFRSVLTPHVHEHNDEIMSCSSFTQDLLVQTLDSVPGLRTLYLRFNRTYNGYPSALARMICHLRHLEIFTFEDDCTDEVIEQLGLHCTHMKKVSLCDSLHVTNASAKHLLQLRKLEFLNLSETGIDKEHYAFLLSELPQIKEIVFRRKEDDILDHVAEKNLHKISHVSGYVQDISKLAQRCRNITNLDICLFTEDLSGLAALTRLHTLRLTEGDYAKCNLNAVLTDIGHRLTDLFLEGIEHVNLQDIITLCPSLSSLTLSLCTLSSLDPDTQLDPQLPHFRNLTSLHISHTHDDERIHDYIRHYVSLKTIRLKWINIFTVEFMREVVRSGTLADLEEIAVHEYWNYAMTVEALELLIKHCSHLKSIEGSKTWRLIPKRFIGKLKRRLLVQNFDLEIN
ncbi:hypothetical protein B7P43_G15751 [Cryptotermes secundus]|uniref:F-box domain-containing protein n=1 Tax=Cryptotermes secundus TaxID=105785 RepID=A0A2J7QWZ1_9NEOP|nr:hypothetical protein B7P43_G15751 [Cryptotermes secundus]